VRCVDASQTHRLGLAVDGVRDGTLQDLELLRNTMWNYAGIVRSPRRLARARRILLELREEIQGFYRDCRLSRELIELRNAVQTALLVVHAAALNPRSRGCHHVIAEE
jgi:L-aspartate oxidase